MNESPHAGERGVSILGALVVALMLGAGTVATFEFATPPLSSLSSEAQVAALTPAQIAAQRAAEEKAAQKKAIEKKCEDVKKSLQGKPPGTRTDDSRTVIPKGKDDIEKDRCVGGVVISADKVGCFGMTTEVDLQSNGSVVSVSKVDTSVTDYGKCKTKYCSVEKRGTANERVCQASVEISGYEPIRKQAREADAHKNSDFPNAQKNLIYDSGNLGAEGKALAKELGLYDKQDEARRDLNVKQANYEEAIAAYTKDKSDAKKELLDAARKDRNEALKNYSKLTSDIKRLEGSGGPPGKEIVVNEEILSDGRIVRTDSGGNVSICDKDKANCKSVTPQPRPGADSGNDRNDTFGRGGGGSGGAGGFGDMFKGLMGGSKPPPGNGTPQAPGSCSPSVICGNNTLYSRNNQCVDQVMQQCQYGCNGNQCAQQPQQGQGCQQAPAQPNPSGCQNGSWRPVYTGACVSSWQCVPSGSGGGTQISAQISCQPQIVDVGMSIAISYSCSSGTSEGSGFQTGGAQTGSTTVTVSNPPANANVATYGVTCTDQGVSASKQCNVQIAKPAIVLIANPKVVQSGKTSAIGWVTSGMQSCVISSPDLPAFTEQHKNTTNVNGTVTTPALTSGATFVLKCVTVGGGTKEASTVVTIQ